MTLIPITERTQYCIVDCGKEICECKPTNKIQMGKEKTAMQMLIEEIKSMKSVATTEQRRYTFQQVLDWLDVGLSIEQEQIEKAFEDGYNHGALYSPLWGKYYYQSKYGNNE